MLLRHRFSELGRRLLHDWTARHAAVATANSVNRSSKSRREDQHPAPLPPSCPYSTFGTAAGNRRQPAEAARSSSSHDIRSPHDLAECGISAFSGLLLLPAHYRIQDHANILKKHQQQQSFGISTSVQSSAEEGGEGVEEPVRSPLLQTPGPLLGSPGQKISVSSTRTAQAVLTGIRQSPQKLNLVAEMVRGMRVEDALTQMAVSVKRAAKTVSKVVHSAQANAVHNFGLEKDRLVVSEAFVGKDRYLKRVRPHGKGKSGKLQHPRARLTVIVKEMSVEQETDLARLRVLRTRGTRMSRAQARLVPHRVLATQWSRKRPPIAAGAAGADGAEL